MSDSNLFDSDSFHRDRMEFKDSLELNRFGNRTGNVPSEDGPIGGESHSLGDSSSLIESASLHGKTEQEIFELKNLIIRNKDKVWIEFHDFKITLFFFFFFDFLIY